MSLLVHHFPPDTSYLQPMLNVLLCHYPLHTPHLQPMLNVPLSLSLFPGHSPFTANVKCPFYTVIPLKKIYVTYFGIELDGLTVYQIKVTKTVELHFRSDWMNMIYMKTLTDTHGSLTQSMILTDSQLIQCQDPYEFLSPKRYLVSTLFRKKTDTNQISFQGILNCYKLI